MYSAVDIKFNYELSKNSTETCKASYNYNAMEQQ